MERSPQDPRIQQTEDIIREELEKENALLNIRVQSEKDHRGFDVISYTTYDSEGNFTFPPHNVMENVFSRIPIEVRRVNRVTLNIDTRPLRLLPQSP